MIGESKLVKHAEAKYDYIKKVNKAIMGVEYPEDFKYPIQLDDIRDSILKMVHVQQDKQLLEVNYYKQRKRGV